MTNQPVDPDKTIPAAQPNLFDKPGDSDKPSPFATAQLPSPTMSSEEKKELIKGLTSPMPQHIKPPVTAQLIVGMLIDLPDEIFEYQKILDTVSILYETRLSDLTFKALSTMMFPGKKDGEPLRIASNDDERKIATSQVLIADEKMKILTNELNEARNELALAKMKFDGAKIAAQLLAGK